MARVRKTDISISKFNTPSDLMATILNLGCVMGILYILRKEYADVVSTSEKEGD